LQEKKRANTHNHRAREEREHLKFLRRTLATLGSLLGEQILVNVGEDTTLGNGDVAEKLVQFLIVSDGELEMTRDDTGLLVITGGVTSQFEDFGSQILEDGGEVDGSTGTDTLSVVTLAEKTVDTTDGESETSFG